MVWIVGQINLQRGHLANWVPVLMGIGAFWFFSLPYEPGAAAYLLAVAVIAAGGGMAYCLGPLWAPLPIGVTLVVFGALMAGVHAQRLAAPQLDFRYYGPVTGRIIAVDRSQSEAVRLTLDQVILDRVVPDRTPDRVRVSLHGPQDWLVPAPGQIVGMTATLSPPSGPVEPGGYDFRRHAWFHRLGAVGYTRTPALLLVPASSETLRLARFRQALTMAVVTRIGGEAGGFAAGIITGDRSAIGADTLADLRVANLAHLLAISGLHMGMLTGLIFLSLRVGLSVWPGLALRLPVKKIAAVGAVLVGAGYLVLSGSNVATERSFVMVCVLFGAVLLDRRALTLRSIAVAATLVLIVRPHEVTGPGFQMSFAATAALIGVFGAVSLARLPKPLRSVASLMLSSLVAGLATAPYGAAHFNQVTHYGLIANLLAVPLMGTVVMPSAVVAALLWPLGLEAVGLVPMGWGLRAILWVAHQVASWPAAAHLVPTPAPYVLGLLTLGGLWVLLWQGWLRWGGLAAIALAFILWPRVDRPLLLISDTGSAVAVLGPEGRAVSRDTGDSFAVETWLRADGDPATQAEAAARPGIDRQVRRFSIQVAGQTVLLVRGKTELAKIGGCDGADILVTDQDNAGQRPCRLFDADILTRTGSVAITSDGRLETARDRSGGRVWNGGAEPIDLTELNPLTAGAAILAALPTDLSLINRGQALTPIGTVRPADAAQGAVNRTGSDRRDGPEP